MNETDFLSIDKHGALGAKNFFCALGPAVKGGALPGYHALSTAPFDRRYPGRPYTMDETDLLTAELSARLWRRYNGPIRLLTDPMGYEYVKTTALADAYDEILPVLDPRCCGIDPHKYWAAGKIAALSRLPVPCVILDMDMMIWRPLSLSGEKLVCACVEFIDKAVYPPFSFFHTAPGYAFPSEWSEEATALNTAFLYIDDENLKKNYTREAFRFMLAEKESPDYWAICMTFAEQRALGMCAEALGIYAKLLYDVAPDSFTHIWGAKGKIRSEEDFRIFYLENCKEKLRQLREESSMDQHQENSNTANARNKVKPIRIVTAFFDIGRAHFAGFERDNETYFSYFRFWARIQNEMLVYCAPEHAARVLSIRGEFGLADRTEIVTVADPFAIEPELYRKMLQAAADPGFQSFRYYHAPENGAPYSYVTMLKAWCLQDAAQRISEDCMLAWVDFGINHCGVTYVRSEDFDFLWEYDFPEKITAFCHSDPAKASLIDTLQFMIPYFDGSAVVMPKALCRPYWEAVRGAMDALVKLGCVDDDQMLLLIAYKDRPDLFDIRLENGWYSAFSLCSHHSFALTKCPTPSPNERAAKTMARLAAAPQHPFIQRVYEKLIRYFYPDIMEESGSGQAAGK